MGDDSRPQRMVSLRPHQGRFLLKLIGCSDRNEAERFRGADLKIPADQIGMLPAGVYYHWQILGLQVVDAAGNSLGAVEEILETGGNDVYVVRAAGRPELLLPAISSVILQVDLEAGQIRVSVPEGLELDS